MGISPPEPPGCLLLRRDDGMPPSGAPPGMPPPPPDDGDASPGCAHGPPMGVAPKGMPRRRWACRWCRRRRWAPWGRADGAMGPRRQGIPLAGARERARRRRHARRRRRQWGLSVYAARPKPWLNRLVAARYTQRKRAGNKRVSLRAETSRRAREPLRVPALGAPTLSIAGPHPTAAAGGLR